MKINNTYSTFLFVIVIVTLNNVFAKSTRIRNSITSDDEKFWERLLKSELSVDPHPPQEPPVKPPVEPPVKPPVEPPVEIPVSKPDSGKCKIKAEIFCDVRSENKTVGSCKDVVEDPAGSKCVSGEPLTSISFIYRGTEPEEVYVEVIGSGDTRADFVVGKNEIFTTEGSFEETASVTVKTVVDGAAGDTLEFGIIDTTCTKEKSLVLGEMYGEYLQLVGYGNADGFATSVYPVRVTYVVANGKVPATVEKAFINSAFRLEGPFNAVKTPTALAKNERLIVYREEQIIDASDKYKTGYTFNFGMNATATAEEPCSAETLTSI